MNTRVIDLSRCEHSAPRSYDYQTSCWCMAARQLEVVVPSSGPSGHLLPASRGEGTRENASPTTSVVMLPTTAYHGQASGVHSHTAVTTAMPVIMPANAAAVPSRFNADSRKTPRIGPLIREATPSAVLTADS